MALKGIWRSPPCSACTSASLEPSYVLRALGREDELAHSSIRFTFGRFSTLEEVDYAVEKIRSQVSRLRELSPLVGDVQRWYRSKIDPMGGTLIFR